MGLWNYYIEIKTDKTTLEHMISDYEKNQTLQEIFTLERFKMIPMMVMMQYLYLL